MSSFEEELKVFYLEQEYNLLFGKKEEVIMDNNIVELNKLINQSIEISGVNVDIEHTWGSYLEEVANHYPLNSSEVKNLKICYMEGRTTNQAISRLSDIRLGYI